MASDNSSKWRLARATLSVAISEGDNRYPRFMPKEADREQYTPKGHKIPVPTWGDVLADLEKVAKAPPPPKPNKGRRSAPRSSKQQ